MRKNSFKQHGARFLCNSLLGIWQVDGLFQYTLSPKRVPLFFAITLVNVDRPNNSFTVVFSDLLLRKVVLKRPPHLKSVATLPCET